MMPKPFVKASKSATAQLESDTKHPTPPQLQQALNECTEPKGASKQQAKGWGITESGPVFIAKKQAFAMLSLNEAGKTLKHHQIGPQGVNQVGNLVCKHSQSANEGDTPLDNATLEEAIQALQAFIAPSMSAPSRLLLLQLHDGTVHYVQARLAMGDLSAADVMRLPTLCAHWQACAGEQAVAWLARWQSCYAELNTALNSMREFAPFPNQPNAPKIPVDLSEQARDLIHQWCKLKKEKRPKELHAASDEAIRKLIYEAWMQQCPDLLPGLLLLTDLFPQLLANQSIEDILHWPRVLNSLPLLFPQHTCSQQLALAPEVLSYFTKTTVTAHGLAMLLTAPIEAKPEHYRVAVTPGAPGKPPTLNLMGIENARGFTRPILPIGQQDNALHSLAMKSFIALLPGMQQPADNTLMNAFTNQTGWLVATQWLLAVQRCNARYQRWINDGLISEQEAAQTLKIPLQLAKHSAVELAEKWDRISAIVKSQSNTTLTLAQVWQIDSLIVNKAYQVLASQASQQANLYDTEVNHTESLTQVLYQLWHTRSHNNQNALSNTCAERLATCPLNLQQALLLGFAEYFPGFLPGHLHVHPRALANALTQSPIAVRDWILGATTLTLDTHVTLDDTATPPSPEQRPCHIECRTHPTAALHKVLDFQFPALVSLCVDLGADAHALEGSDSALHRIAKQGYTTLVEALADKHVFLDNLNADSLSPLDTAMEHYRSLKTKKNPLEAEETAVLARLPECVLALARHGAGRHLQRIETATTFFESFQSTAHANAMHEALTTLRGQCPALDWHLTCQTLFQTESPTLESMKKPWWPQGIDPKVYSTATEGTFYLRPAIARQLFDEKGNPRNTMDHGRRPVVPITDDKGQIIAYAKAYPEAPMIEQAVFQLAQSLFGRGITPSALFRFEQRRSAKGKSTYIPILLSSPVPGDELQSILIPPAELIPLEDNNSTNTSDSATPEHTTINTTSVDNDSSQCNASITLESLDKEALSELILLTLLTTPEDAKPDNYRLRPLPQKDGATRYRIDGIDNDHSFTPAMQYSQDKPRGELNLKSIILCLDAMQQPLHPCTIQQFLTIQNPAQQIENWLEGLMPLQNRINQLFDADTRALLFERESSRIAQWLGYDDQSVILQCPFPRGQIAALWEHWKVLQALLIKKPTTTPLALLRHLYPAASLSYIAAFNSTSQHPLVRFRRVVESAYSEEVKNHFNTLKTSRALYESMDLRHTGIHANELRNTLTHPDNRLGLKAALDEIKMARFEAKQYKTIRKALLKPLPVLTKTRSRFRGLSTSQQQRNNNQAERLEKFNKLYLDSSRQAVLKDLNIHEVLTNLYFNAKTKITDKMRYVQHEHIIIEGLKRAANIQLTLAHLITLTDEDLKTIGQNSPGLIRLTLNHCSQITEKGLKDLLKHTQILQHLSLQDLDKLTTLDIDKTYIHTGFFGGGGEEISYTPTLTHLMIRQCHNLSTVVWKAPTLTQLYLLDCPKLTTWENYHPKLTQLTLQNLPHFNHESLRRLTSHHSHLTHCHLADDSWPLTLKQHCLQPLLKRGHLTKRHLRPYINDETLLWPPVRWPYPSDSILRYIRDTVGVKTINFDAVKGGVNSIEYARLLQIGFKLQWHSYVSSTPNPKRSPDTLNEHLGPVFALTTLADETLVSGSRDNTIKLWHPITFDCLHTLSVHSGPVRALATLTDGTLVSGSQDSTIKLWHPKTFECFHTLRGHSGSVSALTTLPDGTLVSGSLDNTIKLWHPVTFECLHTLRGHSGTVRTLTTLSDGTLVSGSPNDTIKLWHPETFKCLHTLSGHTGSVWALTTLTDGTLVSGSSDNTIKFWHPVTFKCFHTLSGHLGPVYALTTLSGGTLVSGSSDNTIKLWHLNSPVCLESLIESLNKPTNRKSRLNAEPKQEARVTPNHKLKPIQLIQTSRLIILRFPRKPLTAWLDTLKSWLKAWGVHSEAGWSIQTNYDNTNISMTDVSSNNNSTLKSDIISTPFSLTITPPTDLSQTVRIRVINHFTHTLWVGLCPENVELLDTTLILNASRLQKETVLLPPNHRIATTLQLGAPWHAIKALTIQALISNSTEQALYHQFLQHTRHLKALTLNPWAWESHYTLQGHSNSVLALTTLSDGTLVSGSEDNTIKLWHPVTFECLRTLHGHSNDITTLTTLTDGTLVSGSHDGTIKLWHPTTFDCLHSLNEHSSSIRALTTLADGTIVSGSNNNTIKLWHPQTFECLYTLSEHSGFILALTTLSDGTLVSGSDDNTIKLWHPVTFDCLDTLYGHWSSVLALTTLSDGTLVSGSDDTTIKLWYPKTFECLQTLRRHSGSVLALTTLPDGTLVSGSSDNTIKLWHPETFKCLQTLNSHSSHVHALVTLSNYTIVSGRADNTIRVWPGGPKPQPVLPPKTLRQLLIYPPSTTYLPKTWTIQCSNYHSLKQQASSSHTLLQAVLEKLGCPPELYHWDAATQQLTITVTPTSAEHLSTVETAMDTLITSTQAHRKTWHRRNLSNTVSTHTSKTQKTLSSKKPASNPVSPSIDTPNTSITKENNQSSPTQSESGKLEEIREESYSTQSGNSGDIEDSLASNSELNIAPTIHAETSTSSSEVLELSALEEKRAIRLDSSPPEDTLCTLPEEPTPALEETVLKNTVATPITQPQYTDLTLEQLQQQAQYRIQQHEQTIQQLKQDMAYLSRQRQQLSERERCQPSIQGQKELADILGNLQAYLRSHQQTEQSLLSWLKEQATHSTQTVINPHAKVRGNVDATVIGTVEQRTIYQNYPVTLSATDPTSLRPIFRIPPTTSTLPPTINIQVNQAGAIMLGNNNKGIEQGDQSPVFSQAPDP